MAGALLLSGCQPPPVKQARIPVPEAPACTNQDLSPEALFREAKRGVVVVSVEGGEGSGFVVRHQDGSTLLITNSHVVGDSSSATIKWVDGSQDSAAVVANGGGSSPQTDLALLEVRGVRGKVLDLKEARPDVGVDIVAIGAPKGLEFSLTRGVVSGLRDDGEILQIDAPINPGNSGGPVLDQTGCVVGVATFKLTDSEGLNFAVATTSIQRFIANPMASAPRSPSDPPSEEAPVASNSGTAPSVTPTCWFQMTSGSTRLDPSHCSVSSRTNSNGHTVYDIVEPGGLQRSVVLWENKSAEVFLGDERYVGEWSEDDEGDIRVEVNGGVFTFRSRS
jgi:S1-C subfamily serine protease